MGGKCINVVFNYLLVIDLGILELLHQRIDSLLVAKVTVSQVLLIKSLLVSQLHQHPFMVTSILLYLAVKVIILIP